MTESSLITLFAVVVALYFVENLVYAVGVLRGIAPEGDHAAETGTSEELPIVTVLVCARDEEENIGPCVTSLGRLDYPRGKLQLLVVDDKSSDRTPQILRDLSDKVPNLEVLRTGEEVANLKGKVNALAQGMDAARGEIVMITDADCVVPSNWVREYLRHYEPDTGMVASITLLEIGSVYDGIQSLDWGYLLGMAMASANVNVPLSVIGNNMSIRKAAYDSVGGYREIPFSITEDYALFQAIWWNPDWRVKFKASPGLLAISKPTPSLLAWWRQKHRWVKGGQSLKALGYVIFILGLIANTAMVAAPFVLSPFVAFIYIAVKWSADLLIVLPILVRLRRVELLKYFPLHQIYLVLFVLTMPAMILKRNVVWKGRVYKH